MAAAGELHDQDAVFAQLEERIERMARAVTKLRTRNAELEHNLELAARERETLQEQLAKASEELTSVKTRNRDAASRVKNLLSQMEQMDILSEA